MGKKKVVILEWLLVEKKGLTCAKGNIWCGKVFPKPYGFNCLTAAPDLKTGGKKERRDWWYCNGDCHYSFQKAQKKFCQWYDHFSEIPY